MKAPDSNPHLFLLLLTLTSFSHHILLMFAFTSGRSSSALSVNNTELYNRGASSDQNHVRINQLLAENPHITITLGYESVLDELIVAMAEDTAEEATTKCLLNNNISIDYDGLKDDLVDCLRTLGESVKFQIIKAYFELSNDSNQMYWESIKHALQAEEILSEDQKRFLSDKLFVPICTAARSMTYACDKPKYTFIKQYETCTTDLDKARVGLVVHLVQDLCRNEAGWVLDFLDANPAECLEIWASAVKSPKGSTKSCKIDLQQYIPLRNPVEPVKQITTLREFCNVTDRMGTCYSDLVIKSCPGNPKPGAILLSTTKSTRTWWSSKCSALNNNNVLVSLGLCNIGNMYYSFIIIIMLLKILQC